MKRAPVLSSLLETDLYKLTMWQALLHRHPATQAEYRFVCRNPQAAAFPLAEFVRPEDVFAAEQAAQEAKRRQLLKHWPVGDHKCSKCDYQRRVYHLPAQYGVDLSLA